jgi:hypothetical protein
MPGTPQWKKDARKRLQRSQSDSNVNHGRPCMRVSQAVSSAVSGARHAVTHPVDTAQTLAYPVLHPVAAASAVYNTVRGWCGASTRQHAVEHDDADGALERDAAARGPELRQRRAPSGVGNDEKEPSGHRRTQPDPSRSGSSAASAPADRKRREEKWDTEEVNHYVERRRPKPGDSLDDYVDRVYGALTEREIGVSRRDLENAARRFHSFEPSSAPSASSSSSSAVLTRADLTPSEQKEVDDAREQAIQRSRDLAGHGRQAHGRQTNVPADRRERQQAEDQAAAADQAEALVMARLQREREERRRREEE